MPWNIAQAKQRFSEVVKQAATEPQLIFNRGRLAAAVIDAEQLNAFSRWRQDRQRRTLADEFAELRKIAEEDNYKLIVPPRANRPNSFLQMLEEQETLDR